MSVAGSTDILCSSTIFHSQNTFSNHFSSIGSYHVDTKNSVSLFICKDLNHAFSVKVSSCSAVSREWESTFVVADTFCFQLLFCLADGSNFRVSIDNSWNSIIVYMATFT